MSQSEVHAAVPAAETEHTEKNDLNVQLTNRQVELISETWKLVRTDLEKAGTVMFMK